MSNYDIEKFDPPPDPDLICCICQCVLAKPVESPCRHVFCQVCIETWLTNRHTCPTCRERISKQELKSVLPIVQNMINRLQMTCDFKDYGCTEKIVLEMYDSHIRDCGYKMMTCSFTKCKKQILKKDIKNHEEVECEHREELCSGSCGLLVALSDMASHDCVQALKNHIEERDRIIESLRGRLQELSSLTQNLSNRIEELRQQNEERQARLNSWSESETDVTEFSLDDFSDNNDNVSEDSWGSPSNDNADNNVGEDDNVNSVDNEDNQQSDDVEEVDSDAVSGSQGDGSFPSFNSEDERSPERRSVSSSDISDITISSDHQPQRVRADSTMVDSSAEDSDSARTLSQSNSQSTSNVGEHSDHQSDEDQDVDASYQNSDHTNDNTNNTPTSSPVRQVSSENQESDTNDGSETPIQSEERSLNRTSEDRAADSGTSISDLSDRDSDREAPRSWQYSSERIQSRISLPNEPLTSISDSDTPDSDRSPEYHNDEVECSSHQSSSSIPDSDEDRDSSHHSSRRRNWSNSSHTDASYVSNVSRTGESTFLTDQSEGQSECDKSERQSEWDQSEPDCHSDHPGQGDLSNQSNSSRSSQRSSNTSSGQSCNSIESVQTSPIKRQRDKWSSVDESEEDSVDDMVPSQRSPISDSCNRSGRYDETSDNHETELDYHCAGSDSHHSTNSGLDTSVCSSSNEDSENQKNSPQKSNSDNDNSSPCRSSADRDGVIVLSDDGEGTAAHCGELNSPNQHTSSPSADCDNFGSKIVYQTESDHSNVDSGISSLDSCSSKAKSSQHVQKKCTSKLEESSRKRKLDAAFDTKETSNLEAKRKKPSENSTVLPSVNTVSNLLAGQCRENKAKTDLNVKGSNSDSTSKGANSQPNIRGGNSRLSGVSRPSSGACATATRGQASKRRGSASVRNVGRPRYSDDQLMMDFLNSLRQEGGSSDSDSDWEPEADQLVESEDTLSSGFESDSSYEVLVPKTVGELLDEYASDETDESWTPPD